MNDRKEERLNEESNKEAAREPVKHKDPDPPYT